MEARFPRPVLLRFVVNKVALEQVFFFFRGLRFFHVSITLPIRHTHPHMHVAVTRWTNGRTLGSFQKKQRPIVNRRALGINVLLLSRYTVNLKCLLNFDVIHLANFCVYLPVFCKVI